MVRPIDLICPPNVEVVEVAGGIRLTRKVGFSDRRASMELPITLAEYDRWDKEGGYIQDRFPQLDAGQREFIISGITPDEWERMFPPSDED